MNDVKPEDRKEFSDTYFDHHDFSGMCLIGIRFSGCSLRFCDFSGSDLSYAEFHNCDLYHATFTGACLYVTRLTSCDLTKTVFVDSMLNGVRIKDADITHADFGRDVALGRPRKQVSLSPHSERLLTVRAFENFGPIISVERNYDGLRCTSSNIVVNFLDDPSDGAWRFYRRKSEVAKTLQRLHEENGYLGKALEWYFLYRQFDNRADTNIPRRLFRYFLLEIVSGYGVRPSRPFLFWIFTPIVMLTLHVLFSLAGIETVTRSGYSDFAIVTTAGVDYDNLLHLYLCLVQISCLSVFNDLSFSPVGFFLAVAQTTFALCLVGVLLASLTKRIALL